MIEMDFLNRRNLFIGLRWPLFLIVVVVSLSSGVAQERRQNHIGFRVEYLRDTLRHVDSSGAPRILQTSIWYPSKYAWGTKMNYEDYFLLSASERQDVPPDARGRGALKSEYVRILASRGIDEKSARALFSLPMRACLDALPRFDQCPLILVAQGNLQSAHHQAILCEALASRGYVVMTCPSPTRITGPMKNDEDAGRIMNDQLFDLEFIFDYARTLPYVDQRRVGIVCHSFGGRAGAVFANLHSEIRAIVSLEGGIALQSAVESIRQHPRFSPKRLKADILHFYETQDKSAKADFSLLNFLTNVHTSTVLLPHFHHFYFSTFGAAAGTIPGLVQGSSSDVAREWKQLEDSTIDFLDGRLKGGEVRRDTLDRKNNDREGLR